MQEGEDIFKITEANGKGLTATIGQTFCILEAVI